MLNIQTSVVVVVAASYCGDVLQVLGNSSGRKISLTQQNIETALIKTNPEHSEPQTWKKVHLPKGQ